MSSPVQRELVAVESAALPRTGWGLAPARGAYYRPAGERPRLAFIACHYNLDFSEHYLAEPLAASGYGFLGWNTRFCGHDGYFVLERALGDIGLGVAWLREQGVEIVVLLGNSGGGSLLAAYGAHAAAEGSPCELFVSVAAHPGRPEVLTNWLDPAAADETDPVATDPALDMYNPENGPPYPADFVERYRAAQRARNERITDWCKSELERVRAAGYSDRLFTVHRTWADLRFVDPGIDPSDRPTPACYRGDPARANRGAEGIAAWCSLRTWLSMWSLSESPCRSADTFARIDAPALVVQAASDCGVFPSDTRAIYEALASPDKRFLDLPGDHYFRGSNNARQELAGVIADWVQARAGEP